jgi:hypothetical protein
MARKDLAQIEAARVKNKERKRRERSLERKKKEEEEDKENERKEKVRLRSKARRERQKEYVASLERQVANGPETSSKERLMAEFNKKYGDNWENMAP